MRFIERPKFLDNGFEWPASLKQEIREGEERKKERKWEEESEENWIKKEWMGKRLIDVKEIWT